MVNILQSLSKTVHLSIVLAILLFLGLFSFDTQVIIPSGATQRLFSRRGFIRISVKVPAEKIEESKDEIYGIMRQIRGLKPSEKDDLPLIKQWRLKISTME